MKNGGQNKFSLFPRNASLFLSPSLQMIGARVSSSGRQPAGTEPAATSTTLLGGGSYLPTPSTISSDPALPLLNLAVLYQKMDSLRRFLSDSIDRNATITDEHLRIASSEIFSTVPLVISNASALVSSQSHLDSSLQYLVLPSDSLQDRADPRGFPHEQRSETQADLKRPRNPETVADLTVPMISGRGPDLDSDSKGPRIAGTVADPVDPDPDPNGSKSDPTADGGADEIVEIDAVELMTDHVHVCEICGKGFKRDANLRMHMRAHGNRFKTLEALSKPGSDPCSKLRILFSCPFPGCCRNRAHEKFRPLKSAACTKNHFKRSHFPKLYSCDRCKEKRFAVLADLKSHLRSCGERRWRCSCGTSFSRKDKLFGHVALFEGHSPAVGVEGGGDGEEGRGEGLDPEFFEGVVEEIGGMGGGLG